MNSPLLSQQALHLHTDLLDFLSSLLLPSKELDLFKLKEGNDAGVDVDVDVDET